METKRRKMQRPIIFFENKCQQAVWEIVLKDEIGAGFWSKVKFDTTKYLFAKTYVFPKKPGISFQPALTSFYFDNLDFLADNGYYIAIIMKLVERYDIELQDLARLAMFAESFVATDPKDNNSTYRRVQVSYFPIDERNVPPEYRESLLETVKYFRNLGITMEDVVQTLKDEPKTEKEIRKCLIGISELLKTKVSLKELGLENN